MVLYTMYKVQNNYLIKHHITSKSKLVHYDLDRAAIDGSLSSDTYNTAVAISESLSERWTSFLSPASDPVESAPVEVEPSLFAPS